jgi:hypothetical protein
MTVYYAQNSTVNINSANQWNTAANGSGTFLTWPPASNDVLMANGKTSITINVSTTAAEIRNDTANGSTNGGGYILGNGITLTAAGYGGSATLITFSTASPGKAYIVGNLQGGAVFALSNSGTGTVEITGNCTAGTSYGINAADAGIINITGNITGGSGAGAYGLYNASAGTVTQTGNVTGGSASVTYGVNNNGIGTVTVTGNSTGGSFSLSTAHGIYNTSTGIVNLNGAANASPTTMAAGLYGLVAGGFTYARGACYASATGAMPCAGFIRFEPTATGFLYMRDATLMERAYVQAAYATSYGMPATADVRYNTAYNLGTLTGSLRVPSASSVVSGVLVDNTVGTADLLTAADLRAAIGLSSANLDTQLDAIPTAAEIWGYTTRELTSASGLTAQDVWEYATRTLTAGSGITAQDVWEYATRSLTEAPDVPTVEEIAAEVRTELTPELSRVANCATVESTGDQLAGLL